MENKKEHRQYAKYFNIPVRSQGMTVYFFGQDGILKTDSLIHAADHQTLKNLDYKSWIKNMPKKERAAYIQGHKRPNGIAGNFDIEYLNKMFKKDGENDFGLILDGRIYSKTVHKLKKGDSFEKFLEMLKETAKKEERYKRILKEDPVHAFILSVNISIERATDNMRTDTFDFIRVTILTPSCRKDTQDFARMNLKKIIELVTERISLDRKFQRYGVPVNFLKITKITLTKSKEIEILYELKEGR